MAGFNGATIWGFDFGDTIHFTDVADVRSFRLDYLDDQLGFGIIDGNTPFTDALTYSLSLPSDHRGNFIASANPLGGVDVKLSS
ncbi:hypothetical protein [Phyllobacterium lublinensis]|uniref:hypothetical protein n=1 Tax=Phyllobacterium lublinensis TaxID=2875708 RepID=UPI001CCB9552|nr:hypothetical protein [Phyllobacterium sp. 2063]MBZ9656574.1 hypothetical protein [Phyllobacterium sp. 2063]